MSAEVTNLTPHLQVVSRFDKEDAATDKDAREILQSLVQSGRKITGLLVCSMIDSRFLS